MTTRRKLKAQQLTIFRRGGRRKGAGRKPRGKRACVSHKTRKRLGAHTPVHVTVRLREALPSLRHRAELAVIHKAFAAGTERFGFRLVHFSIQSNHMHLIVEAQHRFALAKGMQGLLVRVARALNRLWRRKGSVFADRYHAEHLATPRHVRNALVYVLHNSRRHGIHHHGIDPFSSGAWFGGWIHARAARNDWAEIHERAPLSSARTWLLKAGWRRHGLIAWNETPGSRSRR